MNVIPQRVKDAGVALTAPLARALIQGGVHPNVLTTVGTVILVGSGVTFGVGEIRVGVRAGGVGFVAVGVPAIIFGGGSRADGVMLFWFVVVLAFVSAVTVIQRIVHVARVATGAPQPPPLIPKRETLPGVAAARRKGH